MDPTVPNTEQDDKGEVKLDYEERAALRSAIRLIFDLRGASLDTSHFSKASGECAGIVERYLADALLVSSTQ